MQADKDCNKNITRCFPETLGTPVLEVGLADTEITVMLCGCLLLLTASALINCNCVVYTTSSLSESAVEMHLAQIKGSIYRKVRFISIVCSVIKRKWEWHMSYLFWTAEVVDMGKPAVYVMKSICKQSIVTTSLPSGLVLTEKNVDVTNRILFHSILQSQRPLSVYNALRPLKL